MGQVRVCKYENEYRYIVETDFMTTVGYGDTIENAKNDAIMTMSMTDSLKYINSITKIEKPKTLLDRLKEFILVRK